MFAAPTPTVSALLKGVQDGIAFKDQSSGNITILANDADCGRYQCANLTGLTAGANWNLLNTGGYILLTADIP